MKKTEFISNPDKDETIIVRTETFDGLLDYNKALRNEGFVGSKEMHHVANIPGTLIEHYCNQTGITWAEFWADKKHIKSMLNDPDLSGFRVKLGQV